MHAQPAETPAAVATIAIRKCEASLGQAFAVVRVHGYLRSHDSSSQPKKKAYEAIVVQRLPTAAASGIP